MRIIHKGIADFASLRLNNYFYADKTGLLYKLLEVEQPYFLSRPRRFGKTLLVSTLEAILKGRRELFEGLWIGGSDYDWAPRPVIRLSFATVQPASLKALNQDLLETLERIAGREGLALNGSTPGRAFKNLLEDMFAKHGREVAVLIDEYDAPILANIGDADLGERIRMGMRAFYSVLKDSDQARGFTFLTGVTKFAKTSIFSELNNLSDLTLNPSFSEICGLTMEDLDELVEDQAGASPQGGVAGFPRGLELFLANGSLPPGADKDDLRKEILARYDGYSWDGESRLLNPWSVLSAFADGMLSNYWIESGAPNFLAAIGRKDWRAYEIFKAGASLTAKINAIDVGKMDPLPLLLQAGYLTVDWIDKASADWKYHLRLPNQEVEAAMVELALGLDAAISELPAMRRRAEAMRAALAGLDADGFQAAFEACLGSIPQNLHSPNEGYYHTVLMLHLGLAGQRYESEGRSGDGVFDVHVRTAEGFDIIIELKYVSSADKRSKKELTAAQLAAAMRRAAAKALEQIESRRYNLRFQGEGNGIYKMALVVAGRTDALAVFEKAGDWRLAPGPDGRLRVVRV
jgi:hypothetical protein